MIKFSVISAAACAALVGMANTADAQYPYGGLGGVPNNGPAYSPYLNLLRPGNTAGANYYGLVRPELEFRSAYRGLQQQFNTQMSFQDQADQRGLPITGHAATFLNTGGYFLNSSPSGGQRAGFGQMQQGRQMLQGPGQASRGQVGPIR
jgi:hypothetical protein